MEMQVPAKLNIGLKITGLREDGYHLLDTVMQTVDLCDTLRIFPREDGEIRISCDRPEVPTDEHNLIVRGIRLLTDRGADVELTKRIPMGAGMGGGSADGAAAMKMVNALYHLGCSETELEQLAARLGADLPFFIRGGRQRCRGIGEILTPLEPVEEIYVVVKPEFGISTVEMYRGWDERQQCPEGRRHLKNPAEAGGLYASGAVPCINDLEPVAAAMYPVIPEIRQRLLRNGAKLASMTGSGSAVFGIFDSENEAEAYIRKTGEGVLCRAC